MFITLFPNDLSIKVVYLGHSWTICIEFACYSGSKRDFAALGPHTLTRNAAQRAHNCQEMRRVRGEKQLRRAASMATSDRNAATKLQQQRNKAERSASMNVHTKPGGFAFGGTGRWAISCTGGIALTTSLCIYQRIWSRLSSENVNQ